METCNKWRTLPVNFKIYFVSLCSLCTLSLTWMLVIQGYFKRNVEIPEPCTYPTGRNKFSWRPDVGQYLDQYNNLCLSMLTEQRLAGSGSRWSDPGPRGVKRRTLDLFWNLSSDGSPEWRGSQLCPCLPRTVFELDTDILSTYESFSWRQLELAITNITSGGSWKPASCVARQRIAIIIPYRNRESHLKVLLSVLHRVLQSQFVEYRIFVIEQLWPEIFNRAALLNVGYLEVGKLGRFDCYVFHDVDLLPELNMNLYSCVQSPLHIGAYMNKWQYKLPYPEFFGGAIALRGEDVEKINGFPNHYFGWGGEDDATYCRVQKAEFPVYRHPVCIGKTFMIKHSQDKTNPPNPKRFRYKTEYLPDDGLSTIRYTVKRTEWRKLYTLIQVSVEREFDMRCVINKSVAPSVDGNYVDCYNEDNFLNQTLDCCHSIRNEIYCCNLALYYARVIRCTVLVLLSVIVTGLLYVYRRLLLPLLHR